jgi:hypothetical protein
MERIGLRNTIESPENPPEMERTGLRGTIESPQNSPNS